MNAAFRSATAPSRISRLTQRMMTVLFNGRSMARWAALDAAARYRTGRGLLSCLVRCRPREWPPPNDPEPRREPHDRPAPARSRRPHPRPAARARDARELPQLLDERDP